MTRPPPTSSSSSSLSTRNNMKPSTCKTTTATSSSRNNNIMSSSDGTTTFAVTTTTCSTTTTTPTTTTTTTIICNTSPYCCCARPRRGCGRRFVRYRFLVRLIILIVMIMSFYQLKQIHEYYWILPSYPSTVSSSKTTTEITTSKYKQKYNHATKPNSNSSTASDEASSSFPSSSSSDDEKRKRNNNTNTNTNNKDRIDDGSSSSSSSSNNTVNITTTTTITSDARDSNGYLGYIADPTFLRKEVQEFLNEYEYEHEDNNNKKKKENPYWILLNNYGRYNGKNNTTTTTITNRDDDHDVDDLDLLLLLGENNDDANDDDDNNDENLSSNYICGFGPGQGIEEPPGYKLMTEKLRVFVDSNNMEDKDNSSNSNNNNKSTTTTTLHYRPTTTTKSKKNIKIFCGIYSYSLKRQVVRVQALSWGYRCDGFVIFSNETIPELNIIDLIHDGVESYNNMWQKVRSIWKYIYQNYLDQYDYFHLCGDDTYVIVPNLRRYLLGLIDHQQPLHIGQILPNKNQMISGGPGYTLNKAAIQILIEHGLTHPTKCQPTAISSAEDRFVSNCFQSIIVETTTLIHNPDTRDYRTGEQLYHDNHPSTLYTFRSTTATRRGASYLSKNAYYWERLQHPSSSSSSSSNTDNNNSSSSSIITKKTKFVGPKHELDSIGKYSISFHHISNPQYVARFHSILYPTTCPSNTPLGIGLRQHRRIFQE